VSGGKKTLADWTVGAEAIVYQSCGACGSLQYFRRSFCCACGASDPIEKRASGAGTVYATSLVVRAATPETRALSEFIEARRNIAALQTYHNAGGMILRAPGREGGVMRPSDERVHQALAQRGEKMLPFYRSMVVWKDLYTVWGGEFDWTYGALGIVSFSNELWNSNMNAGRDQLGTGFGFASPVVINGKVIVTHDLNVAVYGLLQ